jgi:hypothetical protein
VEIIIIQGIGAIIFLSGSIWLGKKYVKPTTAKGPKIPVALEMRYGQSYFHYEKRIPFLVPKLKHK